MRAKLMIFEKGLLLFSVPLVVQAVFIGLLIKTHAEVSQDERWAVHTKEVIAKVEETYRTLLEHFSGIHDPGRSAHRSSGRLTSDGLDKVPYQIAELRSLVSDNGSQQSRVETLESRFQGFLGWYKTQEVNARSAERLGAAPELARGARLLGDVRASIDEILGVESRLDQDRVKALSRTSSRQLWVLVVGGLSILATTFVLFLIFFQDIVKRLAILRDNARYHAGGNVSKQQLSGHDEIAEVDRAFDEMASNLLQQRQENETFVYSVSHDLRSPLINLQGFSEELSLSYQDIKALLEHDNVPASVREPGLKLLKENIDESTRFIQTAVDRLARIIDALLRLSRAGRVEYQWQSTDVQPIVRRIVEALKDTITGRNAEVDIGELPPSWSDPTAVEQIFANLIGNAVQYLDPDRPGRIEVGIVDHSLADSPAGFNSYFVRDNGLGIPEAYHDRVFTAFNRLQANVAQGEGIGLTLVRRMVERLGGKIWLESASGVGSTFFVALQAMPRLDLPGESEGQHRSKRRDRGV